MKTKAKSAANKSGSSGTKGSKKTFVIVGTGGRARMFMEAILQNHSKNSRLAAFCDTNPTRMDFHNTDFVEPIGLKPIPTYLASDFDRMIREKKPDTVIVTSMDRTHHTYIVRAMELGCDVISEKPMTTDEKKCAAIFHAIERTGKNLRVTFNYRYSPTRTTLKKLLMEGVIGDVRSVHFEWLLDTRHGADYFRRWHRDKRNSGGLMVHKSTHHFDLVNWWLDAEPETVFAFGHLGFYGRENAEARGEGRSYYRSTGSPGAKNDPFALDLQSRKGLEGLYLNGEKHDGYLRDQNVFGDGISIEDTMSVLVRYNTGAQLSYSLTAYAPWEGYRISFNGTKGRLELEQQERSYINAGSGAIGEGESSSHRLLVLPHWKSPYEAEVPDAVGGHGGGDIPMLEDIFGKNPPKDPYGRSASHIDGARSIMVGIAANRSMQTGQAVQISDLRTY